MKREKKRISNKAKLTLLIIAMILDIFLFLVFFWGCPVEGKVSDEHWYSKMEYTSDYAFNIEKDPNKDFKILAISDPQLSDTVDVFKPGDPLKEMEQLVNSDRPDLIIVMGDITWTGFTKLSTINFVKCIDSFGIPWAPIIGNHEDEKEQGYFGNVDKNWVADKYLKANNCIFKKGPNNIGGVGNYVINITENGKIVESLIMMDTHSKRVYPEIDNKLHYDYIYDSQMDWYKWVIDGLTKQNDNVTPESMLYIHIPLCEYKDAYKYWESTKFDPAIGFGHKNEDEWPGYVNSGMFDVLKEKNSTKYVFAGHDHLNDYSVLYEGIRLTYTTKTGFRTSFHEGQTGGTYITIGDEIKITPKYIEY